MKMIIKADRHAIFPAGSPPTVDMQAKPGVLELVIAAPNDGVRVVVQIEGNDAAHFGMAIIMGAASSLMQAPAAPPPATNGVHRG